MVGQLFFLSFFVTCCNCYAAAVAVFILFYIYFSFVVVPLKNVKCTVRKRSWNVLFRFSSSWRKIFSASSFPVIIIKLLLLIFPLLRNRSIVNEMVSFFSKKKKWKACKGDGNGQCVWVFMFIYREREREGKPQRQQQNYYKLIHWISTGKSCH